MFSTPIIIAVLAFVVAGLLAEKVVKWGTKEQEGVVERRRAARELASTIKETGQDDFAEFVNNLSDGDIKSLIEKVHSFAVTVKAGGKSLLVKNGDKIFKSILNEKLNTAEGRAWLSALLVEATPAKPEASTIKQIVQ